MEFWKMNGAGNDFINIQKLKLFKKFKITVDKLSFYDIIKNLTVKFIKNTAESLILSSTSFFKITVLLTCLRI